MIHARHPVATRHALSRTAALDPLLPFEIGSANGRQALETGLRLKALVVPEVDLDFHPSCDCIATISANAPAVSDRWAGIIYRLSLRKTVPA
jgi:hypothetical protein